MVPRGSAPRPKEGVGLFLYGLSVSDYDRRAMNGNRRERITAFSRSVMLRNVVMRKYSIDDMRLFYENALRFLKQF